jgi:hypothetical protein
MLRRHLQAQQLGWRVLVRNVSSAKSSSAAKRKRTTLTELRETASLLAMTAKELRTAHKALGW